MNLKHKETPKTISKGVISLNKQEEIKKGNKKNNDILKRLRKYPHLKNTEFEWYLLIKDGVKLQVIFNDEFITKISYESGNDFKDTELEKLFDYEMLSDTKEEDGTITQTVDIDIEDLLPILEDLKVINK
jgi:hypothetical protein